MGDVLNWVFIRIFGIFAGMGKLKESVEMIAKFALGPWIKSRWFFMLFFFGIWQEGRLNMERCTLERVTFLEFFITQTYKKKFYFTSLTGLNGLFFETERCWKGAERKGSRSSLEGATTTGNGAIWNGSLGSIAPGPFGLAAWLLKFVVKICSFFSSSY